VIRNQIQVSNYTLVNIYIEPNIKIIYPIIVTIILYVTMIFIENRLISTISMLLIPIIIIRNHRQRFINKEKVYKNLMEKRIGFPNFRELLQFFFTRILHAKYYKHV